MNRVDAIMGEGDPTLFPTQTPPQGAEAQPAISLNSLTTHSFSRGIQTVQQRFMQCLFHAIQIYFTLMWQTGDPQACLL